MSKQINISDWIEKSKANPDKYLFRQIVEILINAIAYTKFLKGNMFLKGGTLMALAHESQRMTGDVDFSWLEPFHKDAMLNIDKIIKESLNNSLKRVKNDLGYLNLVCKVQSIEKKPDWKQKNLSFPALKIRIGYAKVNTRQAQLLDQNKSSQVLTVDISFNEDIISSHELILSDTQETINAYTPIEIISEKFRALIQQIYRGRNRRQDVYDIDFLLKQFKFDDLEKKAILQNMLRKSESRSIYPNPKSLSDIRIKEKAQQEWNTLNLELNQKNKLPDFEECYQNIRCFYESLPWQ